MWEILLDVYTHSSCVLFNVKCSRKRFVSVSAIVKMLEMCLFLTQHNLSLGSKSSNNEDHIKLIRCYILLLKNQHRVGGGIHFMAKVQGYITRSETTAIPHKKM